ncbi:hypothetical protein [Streptomyces sp. CC219B]|uniref:hypothetical protein n=1 Tax=Streptomyces sp. CC219B TaxID=3044574 RepID=UPI0024A7BA16|nr:hypothetical protein [Streptomyces sp. CC219B]
MVVLALTGFSTGRGHGGSSDGDGDSGGGCSSSSQNHDSSSGSRHDDDDDDGSGSGPGPDGSAELQGETTVKLVSCATETSPYATVEVTNPNTTGTDVTVVFHFLDAQSAVVDMQSVDEHVPANRTVTVQVDLSQHVDPAKVDHCEAELMPSV